MDETPASNQPVPNKSRKLHVVIRLAALFAVVAAGFALWWATHESETAVDARSQRSQLDALTHEVVQLRSIADALRARLDDGEKVDKSVREQLLGLDQRTRLIEDSIANLA